MHEVGLTGKGDHSGELLGVALASDAFYHFDPHDRAGDAGVREFGLDQFDQVFGLNGPAGDYLDVSPGWRLPDLISDNAHVILPRVVLRSRLVIRFVFSSWRRPQGRDQPAFS